jgi:hypothetical protein
MLQLGAIRNFSASWQVTSNQNLNRSLSISFGLYVCVCVCDSVCVHVGTSTVILLPKTENNYTEWDDAANLTLNVPVLCIRILQILSILRVPMQLRASPNLLTLLI